MQFSIVTSIYRDGALAHAFCAEIARVFADYLKLGEDRLAGVIEVILVNDGSPDDSLEHLVRLKQAFDFVTVIDLSRNFGQHEALACGFRAARGECVIRLNVDMQDPPRELPKLIDAIRSGRHDLVVGQYSERRSPLIDRLTAFVYFEAFRLLTGLEVPQRTAPMRAMNRVFIDSYNQLTEKTRFPQGLDQWLGFRHHYVEIEHVPRQSGRSSYNFWSRTRLAVSGILYFTDRPLKIVGSLGLAMAAAGMLLGLVIILQKVLGSPLLPGYASLASIALFGFGCQIGSVGVLGLYAGRIFREVQNRPLYVIREIY